jgi:hypothetical protein
MRTGVKQMVAGVVALLTGVAMLPGVGVYLLVREGADSELFMAPGTVTVPAGRAGRYYLWNEFHAMIDGRVFQRPEQLPDGVRIDVTNVETGRAVPLTGRTSISVTGGDHSRRSIGYLDLDAPASLHISVEGLDEQWVLRFSRSRFKELAGLILAGALLAMALAVGGIALIVWGVVRLTRAGKTPPALEPA